MRAPDSRGSHGHVEPELVFGISLLIGLALAWSSLSGAMHGSVDIIAAGTRLLVGIALAWAGCYGIAALFTSFARSADERTEALRVANARESANLAALPANDDDAS